MGLAELFEGHSGGFEGFAASRNCLGGGSGLTFWQSHSESIVVWCVRHKTVQGSLEIHSPRAPGAWIRPALNLTYMQP